MKKIVFPFYLKLACVLISLIAIGYLFVIGKSLLEPLLFSFLLSILLLPVANFLELRFRMPRSLSAIISVLLCLLVFSLLLYLMGTQISSLSAEWPAFKQQILDLFHNFQNWIQHRFNLNIDQQSEYINNSTKTVLSSSGVILETTIMSVSSIFILLVFTLIYTFFLLLYRRLLMRFIVVAFSEKYIDVIYEITVQVKYIVRKYITGLFLETSIVVGIICLVFWILGMKYVFLLALLVGLLNLIPYIGIFVGILISASITFATVDPNHALYVVIALLIIHFLDSNIIMPKIVGSKVKLNPLIVILGVVLGGMMWGIAGMFLAIPFVAIAKVIFDRISSFEAWGILLGDEEAPPKEMKRVLEKLNDVEQKEKKK